MARSPLTVAVCQMTSTDDVESNLMQIEELLSRIPAGSGARAAFFPENSLYFRIKEGESVRGLLETDEVFGTLRALALENRIHLHLTVPLRIDGHLNNSSVWVTDQGQLRPTYQKMHLFDIDLENGPQVRESDVFRHGSGPSIIEIDGWLFGESICYDVRFSELYSLYARHKVDVLLVPSAFLPRTGEAHWSVLNRARAIEGQCYLLAPAQGGSHRGVSGGVRETYGHSLVVDPWGTTLGEVTRRGPDVLLQTLDPSVIEKVRRQIPMENHRRLPLANVPVRKIQTGSHDSV